MGVEVTAATKRTKGLISIPASGSDIFFLVGCEAELANRKRASLSPPPQRNAIKKKKEQAKKHFFVFFTISPKPPASPRNDHQRTYQPRARLLIAPFLRGRRPDQAGSMAH